MKVTFVMSRGSNSGGNRVIATYAGRLAERGHEVHVIWHRVEKPSGKRKAIAMLKGRRPPRTQDGSIYFDDLPITQSFQAAPGAIIGDDDVHDADAVIATWWETAFEVAALSPAKGRKFYFVQHHEVHGHLPHHLSRGSYHLPLKKITISQWLVDTMAREYGDTDVALIENSVDTGLFHAGPRAKNAVPTVGLLYSPTRFKGVDVSFQAIEMARAKVPGLRVLAFGSREPDPALPLPEGSRYVQNPPQEELRSLYASCDVWLCGSRSEGFHLPPLEAMACRTPVVSTRVGGAMDVVTDGVDGWLVDVEDAAALGRRLTEVASLPDASWRKMSEAAYARAQSYTWEDATDRFEAALLGDPPPRIARKAG